MEDISTQRMDAVLKIMDLKHRYMEFCDLGYPPKPLGALFTEDGIWTSPSFGTYEGRSAIEGFFSGISSQIVFAAHLALNPIIEVALCGSSAKGRWRALMPFTQEEPGRRVARWILGDYVEDYVLHEDKWMFSRVDFFVNFNVPSDADWAVSAIVRGS